MHKKSAPSIGFDLRERVSPVHYIVFTDQARRTSRFRVVRASIGIKLGQGQWSFKEGDRLDGVLTAHPVNASRKVIIPTKLGTFNLNEEDLEEV